MSEASVRTRKGWEIVSIWNDEISIEVLPGKGGDVLSLKRREDDLEFLWQSPWGLRERGSFGAAYESEGHLMEAYAGGWQTVFPNGGDAVDVYNTTWGMHGEVWLTPFEWRLSERAELQMTCSLVHSPFDVEKSIAVSGSTVTIRESITNVGGIPIETMWSHHPAFGPPFLSADSQIVSSSRSFRIEERLLDGETDVMPGGAGTWPLAPSIDGVPEAVDLARIPHPSEGINRMAYLSDFTDQGILLENRDLDASVRLTWSTDVFPFAWYWLEARSVKSAPWFQRAYVLGLEPASSLPGNGLFEARRAGTALLFEPGETKRVEVSLSVGDANADAR